MVVLLPNAIFNIKQNNHYSADFLFISYFYSLLSFLFKRFIIKNTILTINQLFWFLYGIFNYHKISYLRIVMCVDLEFYSRCFSHRASFFRQFSIFILVQYFLNDCSYSHCTFYEENANTIIYFV